MPDIGSIGSLSSTLSSLAPLGKPDAAPSRLTSIQEPMGDFGAVLKDAVSSLADLGAKADANAMKLATGQDVDIHEVMLSMESASLGMQTALQVRNKLVDAYQEIMRMSV